MSNLVHRTPLIRWLFPQLDGNRGAAAIYDPDRFVQRIDVSCGVSPPMFLNVHLTLAHWPYSWADSPPMKRDADARWPEYYLQAVRRVDQQFADVLQTLERQGLLENAIVVVYSDHGESFESPHESLVPDGDPLIEALHLKPTWGHGTTVLTAHQYRIVLGMRRYGCGCSLDGLAGVEVERAGFVRGHRTNHRRRARRTDRDSVRRPIIAGPCSSSAPAPNTAFDGRIRFTETEYVPKTTLATVGRQAYRRARCQEAFLMYRVDPVTDRIEVKRSRLASLLIDRQYAAIGTLAAPRGGAEAANRPGQDFLDRTADGWDTSPAAREDARRGCGTACAVDRSERGIRRRDRSATRQPVAAPLSPIANQQFPSASQSDVARHKSRSGLMKRRQIAMQIQ